MGGDNQTFKCRLCSVCNGYGCIGQLPGLGGVYQNQNFQLNCAAWKQLRENNPELLDAIHSVPVSKDLLRCGPVTGAEQNIGYEKERDFYNPYFSACKKAGISICVGDGYPDEKLELGLEAVKEIFGKSCAGGNSCAPAFFLKPYPNEVLKKRVEKVNDYAGYIGIDIDSYNILTMRNLCSLEKKSPEQLKEFRSWFSKPFVIKGVFTSEDIELVKEVKPDVVFISNHGGRVETRFGSTANFLEANSHELKKYCREIWVDGGIRTKEDIQTAIYFGADKVIAARPLLKSLFIGGEDGLEEEVDKIIFGE